MSATTGFVRPDRVEPVDDDGNPLAKGRQMPGGKHELAPPPELRKRAPVPLMQLILPVVVVLMLIGMVVVMITSGGGLSAGRFSPWYLMFPVFMLMSVMTMAAHTVGGGTSIAEINEDRKDYLRYLGIQRRRVQHTAKLQHSVLNWDHPSPEVLPSLAGSARMWERQRDHPQFGRVRLGLGTQKLATDLKPPEAAPVDDLEPVSARFLKRFVDTHKTQSGMPLAIQLTHYPYITLTDASGGAASTALVRAMICQLVTFHGPDDLLIAVISEDPDSEAWGWVKWLPHNQHPSAEDALGSARMVYPDVPTAREALEGPLLSKRGTHSKDTPSDKPHLLIVSDRPEAMTPAANLIGRDGIEAVTLIDLRPGGASDMLKTPFSLSIDDGLLYAPDDKNRLTKFAAPDEVSIQFGSDLARMLSRYRPASEMDIIERQVTRKVAKGGLLGHLGIGDPAMVDPAVLQRPQTMREFMRVAIGVTPADELLWLDLKETGQQGTGPHGILIGATGSGKSELLRTLVISLALTHSSERLNMLLVDYKGGAAFLGFEALPHVPAILTNMEAEFHLVERLDVAIRGEINRRQEIFRAAALRPDVLTTVPNIHIYNEIRASGVDLDPLPALFIVVDEFSALLEANPDFAKLFALIGQQGRSMGIYLLLASQELRSGRIAQVQAHLSYSMALRTNNVHESRDVLGTGDAAELPETPGSAYIKTVSGELTRFRSFFTGDAYVPPKRSAAAPAVTAVTAANRARPRLFTAAAVVAETEPTAELSISDNGHGPATGNGGPTTSLTEDAITGVPVAPTQPQPVGVAAPMPLGGPAAPLTGINVKTVAQVLVDRLAGHGMQSHRIWLPPLDYSHTLHDLLTDPELYWSVQPGALKIPIGMIDTPYYQRRDALVLDLMADNAAIIGSSPSGRSTMLQTMIMSAAVTHSSSEIQFYCLDFSNGKLVALADLAHVGSVATRNERAKVSRTIAEMTAIVRRREKLFFEHNITGVADFRRRKAQNDPALKSDRHGDVVLVIDGWTTITKDESADLDHLENPVNLLASQGKSFGVHVVIASTRHQDIKPLLKEELGYRLELRLNEATSSEVNRKKAEAVPNKPGRGIMRSSRPRSGDTYNPEVLDLLVALPILTAEIEPQPLSTEIDVDVRDSIREVNGRNPHHAPPVRLLPVDQPRAEFMREVPPPPAPPPNRAQLRVPLGLGEAELDPKYIDFNDDTQTHFVAFADQQSGKTNLLRHIVTTLVEQNSPEQVRFLIIDYHRRLLGVLPDQAYGPYATTEAELQQNIAILRESLPSRFPPANITPAQLRRRDWWTGGPDIFVIIDNAHELAGGMGRLDSLQPLIEFLSRGRDVGLHVVAAYRSGGVARILYGQGLLGELKNLNVPGLVMSGSKDEGYLIGEVKGTSQPPGRGTLVTRDFIELIQVPHHPAPDDE